MPKYLSIERRQQIQNEIMDAETRCELQAIPISECGEALVPVPAENSYPWYYRHMGLGSPELLVRASVLNCFLEADRTALKHGYRIKVLDGYRNNGLQEELFLLYMRKYVIPDLGYAHTFRNAATAGQIKMMLDDLPREIAQQIVRETTKYVAVPSNDPKRPANHRTGGSIDVWLYTADGRECDLGTEFDWMREPAHTFYHLQEDRESWPSGGSDNDVIHNRELLLYCMAEVGFTPYPYEFWHFDYRNQRYARIRQCYATYGAADHMLPDE